MTNSDVRADRLNISDFVLEAMMSERAGTHKGALSLEAADKIIAYFAAQSSPVNPSPPAMDGEAVARAINPAWWEWFDVHGDLSIEKDAKSHRLQLEAADRVIALAGTGGAVPEGRKPYRSECPCSCHLPGSAKMHRVPCCVPTPTPPDESRSAEGEASDV
jgi:hypothetical protein